MFFVVCKYRKFYLIKKMIHEKSRKRFKGHPKVPGVPQEI